MKDLLDWRAERPLLRYLPLAVVPVLLLASTFPGQFRVPLSYWLLAMAAAAIFAFGQRWPLPVSLAVSAFAVPMLHAPAWGLSGLVPYLGAVALADVVMRSTGWRVAAIATAGWALAVIIGQWNGHDESLPRAAVLVQAGTYVGLPLLLGLYLRGQRTLAATMRDRAVEAENRRDAAESHARAAERSAMARELHDLVAHHIAAILLRIKVARHVVADADPRVTAVLDDVRDTATSALADIRRLLAALRDPELSEAAPVDSAALGTEIAAAVERVRAAGLTVDAEIDSRLDGLDAIGRLTLLRLVQESLTNAMKYADRAAPVRLRLSDRASRAAAAPGIVLDISNRLREPSAAAGDGHGIIGMRERIEMADGTLDVGAVGRYWRLEAHLPTATAQSGVGAQADATATRQAAAPLPATPLDADGGATR
ncbi:two-component sensor histidine kinase [Nocardia sp. 2]|uniref:histidine kinase n=1 Tax=Nocardia acididurans TaxID=2802282 RepID=A0ABS1MDT1_9NOCA|nr:histidine kinase [Nocardia acididurans]MBL1078727.1 two-component sensor histidine kinase [Nocardia acididurans]